jgi:hypothetical protein
MTLVIGCATPDIGFLVAGTLLSVELKLKGHEGPVNGKFHALKVQILNPHTAVAFATRNDVETCFNLIRNLHAELSRNPTLNVCDQLFESYKHAIEKSVDQAPPDCEFLVLQLTPEGRKLAYVTKEGVFFCNRAYIGDPVEYMRIPIDCGHHSDDRGQVLPSTGARGHGAGLTSSPDRLAAALRMLSPFNVSLCALWTSRSRMASATVGLAMASCQ